MVDMFIAMKPIPIIVTVPVFLILVLLIIPMFLFFLVKEIQYNKKIQKYKDIDYNLGIKIIENKAKYIHNQDMYNRQQLDHKHDKNDWLEVKKRINLN